MRARRCFTEPTKTAPTVLRELETPAGGSFPGPVGSSIRHCPASDRSGPAAREIRIEESGVILSVDADFLGESSVGP